MKYWIRQKSADMDDPEADGREVQVVDDEQKVVALGALVADFTVAPQGSNVQCGVRFVGMAVES